MDDPSHRGHQIRVKTFRALIGIHEIISIPGTELSQMLEMSEKERFELQQDLRRDDESTSMILSHRNKVQKGGLRMGEMRCVDNQEPWRFRPAPAFDLVE